MVKNSISGGLMAGKTAGKKKLAVLIDPDRSNLEHFEQIIRLANDHFIDYIFLGGSLVVEDELIKSIDHIKASSGIPVILFPGSGMQVTGRADAILFLSLVSGRNPEYLIGQQVAAAPRVRESGLEVIPTGYMLIDGGRISTAQYISHTIPIPSDKVDVAVATALAATMMGMQVLYLDAGSGADVPVSEEMLHAVNENAGVPLITGGGLRDAETVFLKARSGADVIVVGNAIEKDPSLIIEMSKALKEAEISVEK